MAEQELHSFDDIVKINLKQIHNEFDIILLFTCWFLNFKGYEFKDKNENKVKQLSFYNKLIISCS